MKFIISFSAIILLCLSGYDDACAQSNKKVLNIEDAKQWRNHSVTLSDNGQWYTMLYSLNEKSESEKDSTKVDSLALKVKAYYSEENQTDVLYVFNAKGKVKYEIPNGGCVKFSSASDWIAYQIKPKSKKDKKAKNTIELKHLESGYTIQYKSNANFSFTEEKNYFLSHDENSLSIYDLDNRREHYIGNIGEYLVDKKSDYIAYTISSKDKRGNGIYMYKPQNMTTRALQTGNFIYSNLSWNKEKSALAAYKYNKLEEKIDHVNMNLLVIREIDSEKAECIDYPIKDFTGMNDSTGPAVKEGNHLNKISWSRDDERLFIKTKKYEVKEKKKLVEGKGSQDSATVDVWHWKDKKLLSQRMLEAKNKKNEVYDAVVFFKTKKVIPLTSRDMQGLIMSEGTDNWAIGTDNRDCISDWDIPRNDLYRIDLLTGDKKLIVKNYGGSIELSPDGEKMILWDGQHYWCHNLKEDTKQNISSSLPISFINKEYDCYGFVPNYGLVGWVKDQNAVIVNHKLDLWLLPLDSKSKAVNITSSKDSIRFRFDDLSFKNKSEIEERYIDLSSTNILHAFNIKTKQAGYFQLNTNGLKELVYKAASFSNWGWRSGLIKAKKSDVLIYKMGNFQDYPEAYLSDLNFSDARKITNTNPQQKGYKWGKRVLIDYTNEDGVALQAILSVPDDYKKGKKLPMIVYSYEKLSQGMYDYPTPYLSGASVCEMMYVSDGYLFLRPDIHFNIGTPHSDMHECLDAAITKVIELGYVDEKRIGYEGFSFGGHCGMYISTQENKFAAIAAGAGVSNLVQGFNIDIVSDGSNEQDYYMTQQGRLGTDPTSNTEMYISESAVFNAQNMNTPLLLFHGTADNVVKWEHSFGFYSILRYLKKPVVFLSYKGEGHGLRKKSNRLDMQIRLKEYFDHYLKGKEAGDWIIEELPYTAKEKTKDEEKNKRTLPMWK